MPTSDANNPIIIGSSVTIKGKGFTETSKMWFRAAKRIGGDVETVIKATPKLILFSLLQMLKENILLYLNKVEQNKV